MLAVFISNVIIYNLGSMINQKIPFCQSINSNSVIKNCILYKDAATISAAACKEIGKKMVNELLLIIIITNIVYPMFLF